MVPASLPRMRLATLISPDSPVPLPAVSLGGPIADARNGWHPLAKVLGQPVARLEEVLPWINAHAETLRRRVEQQAEPGLPTDAVTFLPPVVRPPAFRDFYAFEQHVKTARARRGLEMVPAWYEVPVFYFSNSLSLVGQDAVVKGPLASQELDYELELGVVIGAGGRDIPAARAWTHVAGFTVLNDLSARDLQRKEMAVGLGPAKGKDFATAVGPWIVPLGELADRIEGDHLSLAMSARVNGRELSRGNVSTLYHTIPTLVAQASRDAELFPGDLLGTGTVGTGCILELGPENTGGWLKPGDTVELEIERIGVLRTRIGAR